MADQHFKQCVQKSEAINKRIEALNEELERLQEAQQKVDVQRSQAEELKRYLVTQLEPEQENEEFTRIKEAADQR
eukprot:5782133-Alexandrium_andersonii.AAC.1